MSKQTETLKLALNKAFQLGQRYWSWADSEYSSHWKKADAAKAEFDQLVRDTINAALAKQPAQQQEPVAWVLEWTFNGEERGRRLYDDETHCVFDAENDGGVCKPLVYGDTSPPASKPLTDEEIESINVKFAGSRDLARLFARAIEAAHGIKGDA